jgi:hypothetical protein
MPPVDPIRNLQATPNPTNPAGQDPLGHWQDRRGGGGSGAGGQGQSEAEAPEEAATQQEAPHLEGDALATRRGAWSGAEVDFGSAMPWEQAPTPPMAPKGKLGGRSPLGQKPKGPLGGKAATAPLGTGSLVPPTSLGSGRRVEQVYDPSAAVTQTLSALQERRSPPPTAAKPTPTPPEGLAPTGIAKPLAVLRQRAQRAPGPVLPAVELEGLPDEVASAMAQLAEEALSGWPAEAKPEGPPAGHPNPARPDGPRTAPAAQGAPPKGPQSSGRPEPEAKQVPTKAPSQVQASPSAPGTTPPGMPSPATKARPLAADGPPPPPKLSPGAGALMVRVVDLRTDAGISGARLELEPVDNDRLPSFPGQANAQGWWIVPKVPPGLYRLTARHPGKIPSSRELVIQADQLEDVGVVLASP